MNWFKRLFRTSGGTPSSPLAPMPTTGGDSWSMSELDDLLKSRIEPPEHSAPSPDSKYTQQEFDLLHGQAKTFMEQVNESIQLANNSTNPATKVSRLEFGKARLASLQMLSKQHPLITITNLDGMLKCIARLEDEFSRAGYYALTDESSRDYRKTIWQGIDTEDLISGWRYSATMQLRTPLRLLCRHGQIVSAADGQPANDEPQHGSWLPALKTHAELGIDIPEIVITDKTMASDVGPIPVDGGPYLQFLRAVRGVVERQDSIEMRLAALRVELGRPEWQNYISRLGGKEAIYNRFFPAFIEAIPRLPSDAVHALWAAGLTTAARIDAAPDAVLLAIKGVGPAKLKTIRSICEATTDAHAERLDLVTR